MGHSMGGAIVQETALLDAKILKGIILTSTGPLLPVSPVFLNGLLNDFENTVETIMGYAYAPNADRSLVREGTKLMKQSGSKVVYSDFLACDRFDRQNDLVNIAMPCLIVCGEKDKLTPPGLSKTLHQYIHGSILKIIPAVGHMAMVENYRLFNDHVRDFVHGF
jgi:pimeloyl-ACP methyl ester carboxylesterase